MNDTTTSLTSPPIFLLGATVLFWGWQSQLLHFAIPIALILEGSPWIKWRYLLSDKDFNRVADFSSFILVIVVFYLFNQHGIHGLFVLINWLPLLFLLLIVTQTYSTHKGVKLSSLFFSLRRTRNQAKHPQDYRIDLSYPYIITCLLAASASAQYPAWFLVGAYLLIIWGLWTIKSCRYSAVHWIGLMITVIILSYVGQLYLYRLQGQMEQFIVSWFEQWLWSNRDPYRQTTALGDIGELKQSDTILLRVTSTRPVLLREASYNTYFNETWYAKQAGFISVLSNEEKEMSAWNFSLLNQLLNPDYEVTVASYLSQGRGMLALPNNTYKINSSLLFSLQRNNFGALKIDHGPGLIEYTALVGKENVLDSPPTKQDLTLSHHEREQATLHTLANQLGLRQLSPQAAVHKVQTYFEQQFSYSLILKAKQQSNLTPLQNFLLYSHQGHCEYFATATVLLLRAAGIPARYAAGYAAIEYSDLENVYLVRKRHAHAWALAYIQGQWQEVDSTPAIWGEWEANQAAGLSQSLYDLWSWVSYKFSQWRWQREKGDNRWLLWLILPLSFVLLWRLYFSGKISHSAAKQDQKLTHSAVPGETSAFYLIVEHLAAKGYERLPGETIRYWFKRIQLPELNNQDMEVLLTLHYRYRFDPASINHEELVILQAKVTTWIDKTNHF